MARRGGRRRCHGREPWAHARGRHRVANEDACRYDGPLADRLGSSVGEAALEAAAPAYRTVGRPTDDKCGTIVYPYPVRIAGALLKCVPAIAADRAGREIGRAHV